jgi:phosphoribosylpyrophosphate synthetase
MKINQILQIAQKGGIQCLAEAIRRIHLGESVTSLFDIS